jgi:hypothetical protein
MASGWLGGLRFSCEKDKNVTRRQDDRLRQKQYSAANLALFEVLVSLRGIG